MGFKILASSLLRRNVNQILHHTFSPFLPSYISLSSSSQSFAKFFWDKTYKPHMIESYQITACHSCDHSCSYLLNFLHLYTTLFITLHLRFTVTALSTVEVSELLTQSPRNVLRFWSFLYRLLPSWNNVLILNFLQSLKSSTYLSQLKLPIQQLFCWVLSLILTSKSQISLIIVFFLIFLLA